MDADTQIKRAEQIITILNVKAGTTQRTTMMSSESSSRRNIWDEMDHIGAASEADLQNAEKRLGVTLPASLRDQLKIQNGGDLLFYDWSEQTGGSEFAFLADATVDGILPVQEWELASEEEYFPCDGLTNPELLVCIAGHSEDQLCLDFRGNGPNGEPGLTALFVTASPPETHFHESITSLIDNIIRFKEAHA